MIYGISWIITIALLFKNGKAYNILINFPGTECAVSKYNKSNFIFKSSKNLWGCLPQYNFHFLVNSGKNFFTLYPVLYRTEPLISCIAFNITIEEPPLAVPRQFLGFACLIIPLRKY